MFNRRNLHEIYCKKYALRDFVETIMADYPNGINGEMNPEFLRCLLHSSLEIFYCFLRIFLNLKESYNIYFQLHLYSLKI